MPHEPKTRAPAAKPSLPQAGAATSSASGGVAGALRGTAGLAAQRAVVRPAAAAPAQPTLREVAESITVTGGHGGASDKKVVVDEVVKIPRGGLEALKKKGTRIVVCHDSVTDVMTELKGVAPRGWPPGMTWDSVPGLFDSGGNRVIVATRGGKVPPTGDGHGSANLVIHEVGHAIDAAGGGMSNSADFLQARAKDVAKLSAYETQAGTAGQEETFAEDMARFYGGEADHAKNYAGLDAYWKGNPLDKIGK
jgi:hypothetical protein